MRNRGTAAGVPGEQTYAFSTPYEKTSPSKRRGVGWPVQPHKRSQVPNRKCSGTRSQSPTRFPLILSARSCRTPRSRLVGSQGSGFVRFLVREMSQAAPLLAVGGNATNKTQSRSDTAYGQVEAKRAMSA